MGGWRFLILVAGVACAGVPATAAEVTGPPVILDGLTLEVRGRRFRLWGIDAPPLDQTCTRAGRSYPCGKVARAALWDLVAGQDVVCEPVDGAGEVGGAVIATCTAGGFSLNENMVHTGWALADPAVTDRYVATGKEAKAARRGLWHGEFDPPATWRAGAAEPGDGEGPGDGKDDKAK
jgi:endonuclease YncB( thermonuclease family)